jgi:hypothetical protein
MQVTHYGRDYQGMRGAAVNTGIESVSFLRHTAYRATRRQQKETAALY